MMSTPSHSGTRSGFDPRRFRGFTLIELLVVMAILSILMAMLFPAVMGGIEKGRSAACQSNLRQLTAAWMLYCADNKGISLHGEHMDNIYDNFWRGDLANYMGDITDRIMCPSIKPHQPGANQSMGGSWGTAKTAYTFPMRDENGDEIWGEGGYAMNDRLVYAPNGAWWVGAGAYFQRGDNILKPAETPTFSDGIVHLFVGDPLYGPPAYPFYDGGFGGLQRICVDRHNKAINMAFADGHAKRVKLPELFSSGFRYGRDTPETIPNYSNWFPPEYF